jgi:hypothetical protein
MRLCRREDVIGCRGGGHKVRISRLEARRRAGRRRLGAIRLTLRGFPER